MKNNQALRPPLPAPFSHDGIVFVSPTPTTRLSDQVVSAIAASLVKVLPPIVTSNDVNLDAWQMAARLEGIDR